MYHHGHLANEHDCIAGDFVLKGLEISSKYSQNSWSRFHHMAAEALKLPELVSFPKEWTQNNRKFFFHLGNPTVHWIMTNSKANQRFQICVHIADLWEVLTKNLTVTPVVNSYTKHLSNASQHVWSCPSDLGQNSCVTALSFDSQHDYYHTMGFHTFVMLTWVPWLSRSCQRVPKLHCAGAVQTQSKEVFPLTWQQPDIAVKLRPATFL